jgi:hypothetical protein
MRALARFTDWVAAHTHVDRTGRLPAGLSLSLHSRSDAHSIALAALIVEDLLDTCEIIREQAARGEIVYGINYGIGWPNGKRKTLDLVIGIPLVKPDMVPGTRIHRVRSKGSKGDRTPPSDQLTRLLIACEEKSVLTEHAKSEPRVFDELNGSHAIVHGGDRHTIAAGITFINIADRFVSALRQRPDQGVVISVHNQPHDAERMVNHLRGLPRRTAPNLVGFDAYCSFVMDIDNQGRVALWTDPPAPQPGEPDHYDRFIADICRLYTEQFADLSHLPDPDGLSTEEALLALARRYPGLLDETGQLAVDADLAGAPELHAILRAIETQARTEPTG